MLCNRACFAQYAQSLTADRYLLGLISADCADLETVSDRFGHAMGDEYLRMTFTLLKTALSENAAIFRMGGDDRPHRKIRAPMYRRKRARKGTGNCRQSTRA